MLPASAAETSNVVAVRQADFSPINVSNQRTFWDTANATKFTELPATGTKWALDIENKPAGSATVGDDGLKMSVIGGNDKTKIRYQYYVGTNGYPAIDAQAPTLADVFAAPLGWNQTLISGYDEFGVGLQIQLENETAPGVYARVTVTNTADPGTGLRDFKSANWFANTDIHADGYLAGKVVAVRFLTSGVAPDTLLTNFGDFSVVSFGPNLGRDYAYDYRIQDFAILGQTFYFTTKAPAPAVETPAAQPAPVPVPAQIFQRVPAQVVAPVAQQRPVVTEQTPPPPPATAQRVLTELGSSTVQLLETYRVANNGAAPAPATEVLTIAASQRQAGTGAILSTTSFVASMPWAGSSDDQWVDVWAYSTPTYIGTFPVISGVLKITGADLSSLAGGDHHLVLVGQTSGANEVMSLAVAEPASVSNDNVATGQDAGSTIATTGSQDLGWLPWAGIAALALAAIATLGIVIKRRRA
jgi:LPXTG-motif cell wall-anchored protein